MVSSTAAAVLAIGVEQLVTAAMTTGTNASTAHCGNRTG
jgi:hypothetical protein